MNDMIDNLSEQPRASTAVDRMQREVALMAGRLADFLNARFSDKEAVVTSAVEFLNHARNDLPDAQDATGDTGIELPLDRIIYGFGLSSCEVDLLVLAGLAEEHEGFADIFKSLHPQGRARPTTGLAAQLITHQVRERHALRDILETGPAFRHRILRLEGEGPLFTSDLNPAPALWSVLQGIDAWPEALEIVDTVPVLHGLDDWMRQHQAQKAQRILRSGTRCTIVVSADDEELAFQRAIALVRAAEVHAVYPAWPEEPVAHLESLLQVHALARGAVPVVRVPWSDTPRRNTGPGFADYPGTVVLCARGGVDVKGGSRPMIHMVVERMRASAVREMWRKTLPDLAEHAGSLAARFPIEPTLAAQVVADLSLEGNGNEARDCLKEVAQSIRSRATTDLGGGVQLIRPQADWSRLVLPSAQLSQLKEAVQRLDLQSKVIDDWRFLAGRRGARGVRMLFAGPSGTGKTLSAEVLANALNVDLLFVDLSRVVSKWIGETEKNLAQVFDTAERAMAVLLFDEADALFGKRTEVSDAHDRYANLETAYLLSRLERFEGLTILSTNLRQNIDPAFTRRLEFIIEFNEPGREQRLALWRCHLPDEAPLASDVNLEELAGHFPIVGGLIRNAAVAAAFLAAGEGEAIRKRHLIRAIRREYEKAGKAYRDLPSAVATSR